MVSIGGNDFGFEKIITQCVTDFALSPSLFPDYCNDDRSVRKRITSAAAARVRDDIAAGLENVRTAMRNAGHRDGSYDVIVLTCTLGEEGEVIPAATRRMRSYISARTDSFTVRSVPSSSAVSGMTLFVVPDVNRAIR